MKPVEIALLVINVVALIGSLFAVFVLNDFGNAISALETQDTAALGLDPGAFQPFVQTARGILLLGWAWVICVLVASAWNVYQGWLALQKK